MFKVATQPTIAPQPAKGALHHPPPGQYDKPLGVRGSAYHLQTPPKLLANIRRDVLVGPIGPDEFETTPTIMDVAFNLRKELAHDQFAARALGHARTMHDHGEQQSQHVNDKVALAAIGLLVHLHPSCLPAFGGLDTLTVD